jgi:hypothetical protein
MDGRLMVPLLTRDKANHYFYGTIAGVLGLAVAIVGMQFVPFDVYLRSAAFSITPILAAAFAGGLKEWQDSRGTGTVDKWDFVYTAAGALPVSLTALGVCLIDKTL